MAGSAPYRGMCGTHMGTWNGGTAGANYELKRAEISAPYVITNYAFFQPKHRKE